MSQIYFIWSNTLQDSDGPSFHHQEFKTVHTATGMSDTTDCLLALRSTALWASNNNNSSNKVILTRQIISTYNISWRHRGGREVEIYFSFNLGAMWGCVVNATLRPDPTRPDPTAVSPGMSRHPFYRSLGGSQVQASRLRKISPPNGIDPWTYQFVAVIIIIIM